jgi:hypothetical protein
MEESLRGQREHRRLRTPQEEYRALLDRHEIQYGEQYLWDERPGSSFRRRDATRAILGHGDRGLEVHG